MCMCLAGYTGSVCQSLVDACNPTPCMNGGICTQTSPGQFSCLCLPGYGGSTCSNVIDVCQSCPCQNGGSCIGQGGTYVCQCVPGMF